MSFPTSAKALTTQWLTQAMGYPIRDFQIEYFGAGAGIIGMVTRLNLDAEQGPASIIAKFPSPAPENRAVAATYDMYQREVDFYQNIATKIHLRVPKCFHAQFDKTTSDFVLLLEDLKEMRVGDQVAGCTAADAQLVIEGIAALHASTWQTKAAMVSHNNARQQEGMCAGFAMGWPVVSEQFPDLIDDYAASLAPNLPKMVGELLAQMTVDPICVTHADVRLDNIFFGPNEIALVDWQAVCTSAPEQDLAYFVTQSLSDEVRTGHDWVAIYHKALTTNGIQYDLQTCRERYKVCALYLLCYATVIAGTLDLANERGKTLGRTLFGNAMRSLHELKAFELLA
ncbi:MAG: phosphotransferase [Gammaproteobacteria bacterium]|jgi:hypothetical protein|nr:phosphotransferase [Gammaproteobacteria bacterium]